MIISTIIGGLALFASSVNKKFRPATHNNENSLLYSPTIFQEYCKKQTKDSEYLNFEYMTYIKDGIFGDITTIINTAYGHTYSKDQPQDLLQSTKNLEKIIGIPVKHVVYNMDLLRKWNFDNLRRAGVRSLYENLLSWKDIKKGSDMFITGLGRFDITSSYEKVITEKKGRWKFYINGFVSKKEIGEYDTGAYIELYGRYQPPWWLLSVTDVQVHGYFNHATDSLDGREKQKIVSYLVDILQKDDNCRVKKYLIKYYKYWNDSNHAGSIDELWNLLYNDQDLDNLESMKPVQLLNFLREQERKRKLGTDTKYVYLEDLPDCTNMKVLRTKYEITEAGQRLHNCALSYAGKVGRKECVLVMYDDKINKKNMALGEYCMSSKNWVQIRAPCNCLPSKEVGSKFNEYLEVVQMWHKEQHDKSDEDNLE